MKHIARVAHVAMLALVLGGCSGTFQTGDLGEAAGGDADIAAGMIDRWFELARSGQDDFGWWLVHPNTRRDLIGSIDVYREAMSSVDWSGFSYEVVAGRLHDGEYDIDVHVAGGAADVPEPMRGWGLIQFSFTDGEDREVGVMKLEIPPFGEGGILGIGGRQLGS